MSLFYIEYRRWNTDYLKGKYLYRCLVNTLGTEKDIRKKQQLFIMKDMVINTNLSCTSIIISSGSSAEGLDLPDSDRDVMYVIKHVDVIRDVRNIKHPVQRTTLLMETDNDHPGFTRLRLVAGGDGETRFITLKHFESSKNGLYLSVNEFVNNLKRPLAYLQLSSHGPCLSDKGQNLDTVHCFHSRYLPFNAMAWASRYRQQWPPNFAIDKIIEYGCLLVPIGPRTMPDCNVQWRVSFSVAEKQLVYSFNYTQLLCYGLLKLTLKHIINKHKRVEGLLCSYFLKTVLFWVSEEEDIDTFQFPKLFYCFTKCIKKLIVWVNQCFCPNYFIPEHNMFQGKICSDNNIILIQVLETLDIDGLIRNVYSHYNEKYLLLDTIKDSSFIMLDFSFYRICDLAPITDMSSCIETLLLTNILINSKSSIFINDVCKYFYADMSQNAAQLLPTPNIPTERYNKHKRYHRHLQDGTYTDAVSGWLLYASFYYVTGQFNVVLILIDYVLSRCSSDMIILGSGNHTEGQINNYRNHVHSTMSLNDKMRIATIRPVVYLKNSSLIPGELQLEVKEQDITLPSNFMSHCLRFLCYHHLNDIFNRENSLRDLYSTVKDMNYTMPCLLSYSRTILGVCYEISGDKDAAYQCYDDALNCDGFICLSAIRRKSMLFSSS
ncbi:uncharacterized protein LOC134689711 [Mytilus trossulus]|uniref:uncharacterized protein LOC134689711 n=1 Tax=Mytilus trossulus TaxID=6551 RepID=UPI003003BD00